MFFKKGVYFLFCLIILFAIGCEKMTNEIIDGTGTDPGDDDSVSVTPGDIPDDDTKLVGNVVILTGDDKVDDIDQYGGDLYTFNSATIEEDTLTVFVSYGGGCETHEFTLLLEPFFIEDGPFGTGIGISIAHDANLDMCERWVEESYHFDLIPIKKKYQGQYKKDAGSVHLGWTFDPTVTLPDGGPPIDLVYTFTK